MRRLPASGFVSWSAEVAAGGGVGVLAIFEDLGSVDEDVAHAGGVLVGLGVGRMVGERGRSPYGLGLSAELLLAFLECFGAFLPVLQLLLEGLAFEFLSDALGAPPGHLNTVTRLHIPGPTYPAMLFFVPTANSPSICLTSTGQRRLSVEGHG
jgi:hypothetical protein